VRTVGGEREGHKAEAAYREEKHVAVVDVVARAASDLGGEGQGRLVVFHFYVVDYSVFCVNVRVESPFLLHSKLLCVYDTLFVVA